jgi:hypothetical protein
MPLNAAGEGAIQAEAMPFFPLPYRSPFLSLSFFRSSFLFLL